MKIPINLSVKLLRCHPSDRNYDSYGSPVDPTRKIDLFV